MGTPDVDALADLATPWCLRVAVTLRIAERIAGGTTSVADLAAAAGCDPDALGRVLGHLASVGVFARTGPASFGLNHAAEQLSEPSVRLQLDLDGFGDRLARPWGALLGQVRTGEVAFPKVYGRSFWDDLDADPAVAADFDALMGTDGHGPPDPDVLPSGDWAGVRSVVDVGGGTGAFLRAVLDAHPGVRGTLVDLPRTVARALPGLEVVGQSFFDPLPPGADLYLLKSILADWPDAEAIALLRRCAEAARPAGGRVVVVNGVTPGDPSGWGDLLMMVLVGGRERGRDEFTALAAAAGLTVTASGPAGTWPFVVECRPT
jgi:2,7-dihydroxy-5-methyl-1-naphthoate 7-O-methyltransferase